MGAFRLPLGKLLAVYVFLLYFVNKNIFLHTVIWLTFSQPAKRRILIWQAVFCDAITPGMTTGMPSTPFRLEGKSAVVTGGASGIGNAIASAFAEAGARITLLDINPAQLEAAAAAIPGASGIPCDVSDPEQVQQAFAAIGAAGGTDILVNSAGVSHIGTLLSTDVASFDRLFRINVKGSYLVMQAAVAQMVEKKSGVILNMASIAATAGLSDRFAYSMSKGAVLSMTLSVAKDYLQHGIRCNCISPARVHTPFVDDFLSRNYAGKEAEQMARLAAAQPVGRMGTPQEIALLALYLCSDASSFVTGADYPIDGGFFNLR